MRITALFSSLALLAGLAAPAFLTACEGMQNPLAPDPGDAMPEEGDFVRSKALDVPEFDFLWERAKFMLQTDGYGIDLSRTMRGEKLLVTQWKTILAPARYQGKRRRVVMRFEEAGEDRWVVAAAVVAQRNEDIQNPLEIARAVWKADDPDTSRADVLIYKLETGFQDTDADANDTRR